MLFSPLGFERYALVGHVMAQGCPYIQQAPLGNQSTLAIFLVQAPAYLYHQGVQVLALAVVQ